MNSAVRYILYSVFLLLNVLLIVLGIVSLALAAWQWGASVSYGITLSELVAIHARYTNTLVALFLILGGCLVLVGSAGLIAGALLLTNKLKVTAIVFLSVYCATSFVLASAYIVMTSLLWSDYTLVTPLVFDELITRLTGTAYANNHFQFGSYWDEWQLENRCCGLYNATEFYDSIAANNANSSLDWLPNSCCGDKTLPQGDCKWTSDSFFSTPCRYSLYLELTGIYWSQLSMIICVWITYFILLPVTLAVWNLVWLPSAE